jgi:hypothetical protein
VLEGFYRKAALEANDAGDTDSTGNDGGEEAAAGPALQFLTASRQLLGPKLRALLFPAPPQKEGQGQQPQPQSSASKQTAWTAPVQFALDDGSGSGGGGAAAVGGLLESGGCQPLFVFVKGRQLVGVVRGVDTPAMLQQIQQHTGAGGGGETGPGAA